MKDLFASLYNRVFSFFHQSEAASKNIACNRLKLVLMQDRTNLSPAIMDRMRRELVDLLSKYLELDRELLELNFEQEDSQMALMLSIPVIRAKDEDEIQEILRLEDEKNETDDENTEVEEDSEKSDEELGELDEVEEDTEDEEKSENSENIKENTDTSETNEEKNSKVDKTEIVEVEEETDMESVVDKKNKAEKISKKIN